MRAPRHRIRCLVVLLLTVAAPACGQDDAWTEVSRAGVRAADEGRFAEAERLFRDALQLSEQSPEGDARRATSLNNLAFTLHAQGHYLAAERHYREALAMREAALGTDHADVAQSCNNLAELYRVLGRYAEAEPLHQRARAIRERQFGPEHPEVAQTLNNLGGPVRQPGTLRGGRAAVSAGARDSHSVVRRRSSDRGRDPQQPGHALLRPGALRGSQAVVRARACGRAGEARRGAPVAGDHALQPRRAAPRRGASRPSRSSSTGGRSTLREKALGPNHPETAQSLNNLAVAYFANARVRQGRAAVRAQRRDQGSDARHGASRARADAQQPRRAVPEAAAPR